MNFISHTFDYNDETLISCCDDIPLWSAPFGTRLLEMVVYRTNITALDIGFGTGFPLLELAMRLGSSSSVYGIDLWRCAARRAAMKARHYSIENCILIEGSATQIPIADNTIDLIVSNNGLNNITPLPQVIGECNRLAKKNCQVVMTMNLDTTMSELYDIMKTSLRDRGLAAHIGNIDEHIHEKRPALAAIEKVFKENGFNKAGAIHDTFSFKFSDGAALFNHYFLRLAFIEAWRKCIPDPYQKIIMKDIENRITAISRDRTGFTLTVPFVSCDFRKG